MAYNELSSHPLSANKAEANIKVNQFINTFIKAREQGFRGIRFSTNFHDINIADGYTLQDWLSETTQRTLKEVLLAVRRYPFISETDEQEQTEYLSHKYFFKDEANGFSEKECEGLAAAHIYDTLAISFADNQIWNKNLIPIRKEHDESGESAVVEVNNVFSRECFDREGIQIFLESIKEVILVETAVMPDQKPISLRDDHGKDTLLDFAKRLVNSKYVTEVVNSLPYNPRLPRFIKNIFPDGKVELVLYWTDEGLGMVIQTTGRSLRETKMIAEYLKEQFMKS